MRSVIGACVLISAAAATVVACENTERPEALLLHASEVIAFDSNRSGKNAIFLLDVERGGDRHPVWRPDPHAAGHIPSDWSGWMMCPVPGCRSLQPRATASNLR